MVNEIKNITKYLFVSLVLIMSGSCLNAVTMVDLQLVIDSSGNATAVWLLIGDTQTDVQSSYKPAAGSWGTPVTISDPDTAPFFSNLQVRIDSSGNVVVGWLGVDPVNEVFSVYSNTWDTAGPTWVGPEQASTVALNVEGGFTIGISGGDAQAVWSSYSGSDLVLYTNTASLGSWGGSPVTLP